MELTDQTKIAQARKGIIILSIVIPVAVALLFGIKIPSDKFAFLPGIYAFINGLTAFVLILAYFSIKRGKNKTLHRSLIRFALLLSLLFLLLYVLYHITSENTMYGDINGDGQLDILEKNKIGSWKYIYYVILFSHILLSVAVIPMVLFTYLFAWQGDLERHKKWNKFSFPIWLYVAISGVIVYLMISPYY